MYQEIITSRSNAMIHLMIHCVRRDKAISPEELNILVSKVNAMSFPPGATTIALGEYHVYQREMDDERKYLHFLFDLIKTEHPIGLFSLICQLAHSDSVISADEESFLIICSKLLCINEDNAALIQITHGNQRVVEQELRLENIRAHGTGAV